MRALALLLLSGCMVVPSPAASPSARETDGVAEVLAQQVLEEANAARGEHGAGKLSFDAALAAAAQDFAAEIARRGMLTHTSQRAGYGTLMERIDQAGGVVVRAGENLAMMSTRSAMPAAVIRMWLDSPGHRGNLLNPAFTMTGTGAARAGNAWYFVQVYGATRR